MEFKFKDTLIGQKIVLKKNEATIDFAKTMFKVIDNNREFLRPWFEWEKLTLTPEDSLKYLFENQENYKKNKKIEYGIYANNNYVGNISVFDIHKESKSAEVGYWLSKKETRKGFMTEAVKLVEKEFFQNFGLNRIEIICDERNIASKGVVEKCNYFFEGKLRESNYSSHFNGFRNNLLFSKLKSEFV